MTKSEMTSPSSTLDIDQRMKVAYNIDEMYKKAETPNDRREANTRMRDVTTAFSGELKMVDGNLNPFVLYRGIFPNGTQVEHVYNPADDAIWQRERDAKDPHVLKVEEISNTQEPHARHGLEVAKKLKGRIQTARALNLR